METITMTFTPGVSSIFVGLVGPINKRIRFTAQAFRLLIMRVNNGFVSAIKAYQQQRTTQNSTICMCPCDTRKAPGSNIDQIIGFPY